MRQGRPLDAGEQVDVDVASASELARLPRIGPRLAKVIVADREAHGAFGSLAGLDRVAGVGPGLLKVVAPHVAFSGTCRGEACVARGSGPPGALPSGEARLSGEAGLAPTDINSATIAELDALPGVGPAKAAAILQYRKQHGPFTTVEELGRVPGFGAAAVSRLQARVTIR
jgi:competence protein ComEA